MTKSHDMSGLKVRNSDNEGVRFSDGGSNNMKIAKKS